MVLTVLACDGIHLVIFGSCSKTMADATLTTARSGKLLYDMTVLCEWKKEKQRATLPVCEALSVTGGRATIPLMAPHRHAGRGEQQPLLRRHMARHHRTFV